MRSAGSARLALIGALAVDAVGTGLFMPVSLLYFTKVTSLPVPTIGGLMSAAALVTLAVPLVVGRLVDRVGPRQVVLAAQLLQACGFGCYLVSRSVPAVLGCVVVTAVGQRAFWSAFFALVAEVPIVRGGGRGLDQTFALVGMVQSAGYGAGVLAASPVLALGTASAYGWLVAGNAASYVAAAAALLLVPRGRPQRDQAPAGDGNGAAEAGTPARGYRLLLRDRPYLAFTAVNVAFCVCSVWLGVALPLFIIDATQAPHWIVGPVLACNTVLGAIGQPIAARLVRRVSRVTALVTAGTLWAAWGFVTAAALFLTGRWLIAFLVGVVVLYAAAEVIHAPVSNALAADAAPEHSRGSYLAIFQYGFTIATIVVPALFTGLFSVGHALPWIVVGCLAAAAAAGIGIVGRALPAGAVHAPARDAGDAADSVPA